MYDLSDETIDENDVLIMATDGLWERVSNERVCQTFVIKFPAETNKQGSLF